MRMVSALSSTTSCFIDVLDDFLAVRNFDRAIVFAGGEFALYEDMSAFDETFRQLGKPVTEPDDLVPLGPFLPLVVVVLPGPLGRDAELHHGGAVRQSLCFGVLA